MSEDGILSGMHVCVCVVAVLVDIGRQALVAETVETSKYIINPGVIG